MSDRSRGGVTLTIRFAVCAALAATSLVIAMPRDARAGRGVVVEHEHAVRAPSVPTHRVPPFLARHRDVRRPFIPGIVLGWGDPFFDDVPYEAAPPVITPQTAIVREPPRSMPPPPPPAEPKLLSPPAPVAQEPAGTRTIVVQRGDRIDVQTFPVAR